LSIQDVFLSSTDLPPYQHLQATVETLPMKYYSTGTTSHQ
jgi:hypothetical protein